MGTWSTPFNSVENAEKLRQRMKQPWLVENVDGYNTLPDSYDLIGDDSFFDQIMECSVGEDARYLVYIKLQKWLKNIDMFFQVDEDAVEIVSQTLKEFKKG